MDVERSPLRYVLRHTLAILALPVTAVVVVPAWIGRATPAPVLPSSWLEWLFMTLGFAPLLAGAALFATWLWPVGDDRHGTLAPWDSPSRLVVGGPYAHVRNPMISGVLLLLIAEALLPHSAAHAGWAAAFALVNAADIPFPRSPGSDGASVGNTTGTRATTCD